MSTTRMETPTRAPVLPGIKPHVDPEPGRRMHPGEVCPNQRGEVPGRIRRELS